MKDDIKIDGRNSEDILRQVKTIAPYYTPFLDTLDENNPGVVLFKIFSHIIEDVVKRLDQVPEKNFIAFLDMLGMGILPPQPSRVPVTFTVSGGADTCIHIPEKTQLGADATDTRPELTFEIEPGRGFLATPSELKKVYTTNPGTDVIFEHLQHLEQKNRTRLFADGRKNDLQEHILYIGHSDLFNIKGQAKIELMIESPGVGIPAIQSILAMTRRRGPPIVRWEYYGEKIETSQDGEEIKKEGWHPLTLSLDDLKTSEKRKLQKESSRRRQHLLESPGSQRALYRIPLIKVRSIGEEFNKRLKAYGITTIGELLKHTPEDLARKIGTSRRRAEIILEEAEVPHLDFDYDYESKRDESKHDRPDYIGSIRSIGSDRLRTVLLKEWNGEIKEFEINKIKSRWIRCRIMNRYARDVLAKLFQVSISSIKVGIQPYHSDRRDDKDGNSRKGGNGTPRPDMALYNDVPLDLTDILEDKPLYPFGEIPGIYDSFYIASGDAFSKRDADITITFRISKGTPSSSLRLSWEYWNGTGWAVIEGLTDNTDRFTRDKDTSGRDEKTVTFTCPADFEMTGVGGHENYWIRARIVAGDYGKVKFKEDTDKTWQSDTSAIEAPEFTDIRIEYAYKKSGKIPEHIITYNNLDYSPDLVKDGQMTVRVFRPFKMLKEKTPSLYLGFDRPLRGGPINIFFSIEELEYPNRTVIPRFRWEYCSSSSPGTDTWTGLDVVDETGGLTKRGILSLVAPDDMSRKKIFGEELYWIRARLTSGQLEPEPEPVDTSEKETAEEKNDVRKDNIDQELQPCEEAISTLSIDCADEKVSGYPPVLKGIHLNTTWALQTETVTEEILGSSDGTPGQKYFFSKRPVINEEVWINELSSLSSGETGELMEKTPSAVMEVKDADGNTTEFWVKWVRVDDFLDSRQGDRHYVLDSTTGTVNFGDGINGRVPPIGRDNIKTNYQTGGGMTGNIKAFEITSLKSSLPFIDGVSNPEMADGGADTETIDRLVIRGPQNIRNRAHAVAQEDFEWIALEASRKVARAKCIPNLDKECMFKPGWVTLIIVPQNNRKKPVPSVGLKEVVMKYIEERCAGVLTASRQFVVRGPDYLGVSISATLITGSIDMIPVIEKDARQKVVEFLHPLTGGNTGDGWEFGRLPCLSDLYQILEGIDGVDHVEGLSMEIKGTKNGENIIITPENESYPKLEQYNLVFSGEHDITATVRRYDL